MKLENAIEDKGVFIAASGEVEGYDSSVDVEDMSFILHILSSNLYSNPIESLVREYTTNAWDANKEANIDKPIIVSICTDYNGTYWSVRDFGSGLSPELIKTVYSKFGKSTKKTSNDQHGMWGLGKYSGLSYTDNIHIVTIVNNIRYTYMMFKANMGIRIDLLHTEAIDVNDVKDENMSGTEIKVYLKDYKRDNPKFIEACKSQLSYFENVYFNVDTIDNNYKTYVNDNFRCCELYPRDQMHITLGEVVYPMPWTELGMRVIQIPVGIRFAIGELSVTPNRESIMIKDDTKELINKKITMVADDIINIYNSTTSDTSDFDHYTANYNKQAELKLNKKSMYLIHLNGVATVKANNLLFVPYPNIRSTNVSTANIGFIHNVKNRLHSFTKKPGAIDIAYSSVLHMIDDDKTSRIIRAMPIGSSNNTGILYLYNLDFATASTVTLRYIFETYKVSSIVSINYLSAELKDYIYFLNLKKKDKADWRTSIDNFLKFAKSYIDSKCKILDFNNLTPDAAWIAMDKERRKKNFDYHAIRKANQKILIYNVRKGKRWSNTEIGVIERQEISIKDLLTSKCLTIYCPLDDKEEGLKTLFMPRKNVRCIMSSTVNMKYFKSLPNYISLKEFMEGKNRIIAKIATAHIVLKFLNENLHLLCANNFITLLNKEYGEQITTLLEYVKTNCLRKSVNSNVSWTSFLDEIVETSKITKYFDYNMLAILSLVREKSEALKFVSHLKGYVNKVIVQTDNLSFTYESHIDSSSIDFAVEYIKLKKQFKLDTKYYQKEYMDQFIPQIQTPAEEDAILDDFQEIYEANQAYLLASETDSAIQYVEQEEKDYSENTEEGDLNGDILSLDSEI